MTVVVDVVDGTGLVPDHEPVRRLVEAVLDREGYTGEVGVAFVEEATIAGLNERYREAEGPTDVLSFGYSAGEGWMGEADTGKGETAEGELVVCPQVLLLYAAEDRREPGAQLGWTLVHGCLHLAGYDHETDQGEMRQRERMLVRELAYLIDSLSLREAPVARGGDPE
jgi:probable rRNA maturation factor